MPTGTMLGSAAIGHTLVEIWFLKETKTAKKFRMRFANWNFISKPGHLVSQEQSIFRL